MNRDGEFGVGGVGQQTGEQHGNGGCAGHRSSPLLTGGGERFYHQITKTRHSGHRSRKKVLRPATELGRIAQVLAAQKLAVTSQRPGS